MTDNRWAWVLGKKDQVEASTMTFEEHIPSTSSATVCSNIVCSDVTPGTP